MTPTEVEAARLHGLVLSSDLPDLAALWLATGVDTPALRELAGHSSDDAWGYRPIIPWASLIAVGYTG